MGEMKHIPQHLMIALLFENLLMALASLIGPYSYISSRDFIVPTPG